jgi:predicted transposase/invertase (TIGR01784 family)
LKSRLSYNEAKAVTDTAFYDGKAEGKIEGATSKAIEIAKTMLAEGFEITTIAKITKLTTKEIDSLK